MYVFHMYGVIYVLNSFFGVEVVHHPNFIGPHWNISMIFMKIRSIEELITRVRANIDLYKIIRDIWLLENICILTVEYLIPLVRTYVCLYMCPGFACLIVVLCNYFSLASS